MIITLTGSNDFSRQVALHDIVKDFVEEYTDLGVERYEGDSLDPAQISQTLQATPFLASRRLVIMAEPSLQKASQEALEIVLDQLPDTTDLIITEPKPDKRTSYYKTLKSKTDFREFQPLDQVALAQWLVDRAKTEQGHISLNDARYLVERLGTNQLQLDNELTKLLAHNPDVTRQSIDLLTEPNPQTTTFDLIDAALRGSSQKVIQIYQSQRQQKVEPLAILALVGWQLHVLALLKTAGHRTNEAIAKEAGLNPYVIKKSQVIATKVTLQQVKSWLEQAHQLDVKLKSQSIDADEALQQFLLSLGSIG